MTYCHWLNKRRGQSSYFPAITPNSRPPNFKVSSKTHLKSGTSCDILSELHVHVSENCRLLMRKHTDWQTLFSFIKPIFYCHLLMFRFTWFPFYVAVFCEWYWTYKIAKYFWMTVHDLFIYIYNSDFSVFNF